MREEDTIQFHVWLIRNYLDKIESSEMPNDWAVQQSIAGISDALDEIQRISDEQTEEEEQG